MANREGLKNKLVSFGNAQRMSSGQYFSAVLNITDALLICMRENTSQITLRNAKALQGKTSSKFAVLKAKGPFTIMSVVDGDLWCPGSKE